MTEVFFHSFQNGIYQVTVNGHSGYANEGEDIVCSAISILTYTLYCKMSKMQSEDKLNGKMYVSMEKGFCTLSAKPNIKNEEEFKVVIDVIHTGFEALEQEYPDYVKIIKRIDMA